MLLGSIETNTPTIHKQLKKAAFFMRLLHISKFIRTFAPQFKITNTMKRKLFFFALVALALISCNQNEPIVKELSAEFSYTIDSKNPLKVEFTNTSQNGVTVAYWDFGDGAKSYNTNPTHTYSSAGTYKVTLYCRIEELGNVEATKSRYVTVGDQQPSQPDYNKTPYIVGFKLYAIENLLQSIYCRFELVGTNLYGNNSINIKTDYSTEPLTGADCLPYTYTLPQPVIVGDTPYPFDWYKTFTISVYQAAKTTASGVRTLNKTINASDMERTIEYIVKSDDNITKVGILFEYK